jgi:hypothetical protein
MRRDVQKLTAFPKMIKNTDTNILQINRRMAQMSLQYKNIQWVVFGFAVLDNLDDPMKLVGILPLILLMLRVLSVG